MKNEANEEIVFLTLIAGRKQRDALLSALLESGIHLIDTVYGKGTIEASFLRSVLGLVPENSKVVITCVTTYRKADAVLKLVMEKFGFGKPNTGIAFTIPVDRVSY